ncbi:hypothetical protein BSKO_12841 [Bryopsis sp. KO-2023]|nr:hypothetical protein BSKO_12841 [Bryopsis sp. KO-2023]
MVLLQNRHILHAVSTVGHVGCLHRVPSVSSGIGVAQIPRRQRWRRFASPPAFENREVLVGDCVSLVCFCCYKQIAAIVMMSDFPGWTAPLGFNPLRFLEFTSFTATIVGTWVATSWACGNYKMTSTVDLRTALARTSLCWLVAMPVAAAQLVLVTAAEDHVLVGTEGFGSLLPLAASGPGEPLVSAAGVLGTMLIWRCFYVVYLDFLNFRTLGGARVDRDRDAMHFEETIQALIVLGGVAFLGLRAANVFQGDLLWW